MAKKGLGAAAIILDAAGRVLLVKHTYGKLNWDLPGGAAELNESVAGTAIREVREETGLVVMVERMVNRIYYCPIYDMHHFLFRCRPVEAEQQPVATPPEISECGFFAVDALPRPISDFTVQRIRDAVDAALAEPSLVEIGPRQWLEDGE